MADRKDTSIRVRYAKAEKRLVERAAALDHLETATWVRAHTLRLAQERLAEEDRRKKL